MSSASGTFEVKLQPHLLGDTSNDCAPADERERLGLFLSRLPLALTHRRKFFFYGGRLGRSLW